MNIEIPVAADEIERRAIKAITALLAEKKNRAAARLGDLKRNWSQKRIGDCFFWNAVIGAEQNISKK